MHDNINKRFSIPRDPADNRVPFPIAVGAAVGKTLTSILVLNGTDSVLSWADGSRLLVVPTYDGEVLAAWEPEWDDDDRAYVASAGRPDGGPSSC